MKLQENWVALINPVKQESVIELSEEQKEKILEERMADIHSLEVGHVGPTAGEDVKVGEKVFVPISRLTRCERVTVEDINYFFVRSTDIVFVYEEQSSLIQ